MTSRPKVSSPLHDVGARRLAPLISVLTLVLCCVFAPTATGASLTTTLQCSSIQSSILGRAVNYCVALPSDYNSSSKRYPTLYFLHGLFENERSWSEEGGQSILDGLLAAGTIGEFIVVLPDGGDTFFINSFDGHERYEDFFIREFIPAIDQKYRTIPERMARGISGVSMGGYGSLHLGMRHSDVFGAASAQGAALLLRFPNPIPTSGPLSYYARVLQEPFGSPLNEAYWDANSPLTLAKHPELFRGLKLYFDCGDHDRFDFEVGAERLDRILTEEGFPHEFVLRHGGHGWRYLRRYMKYSLMFHWHWFKVAEQEWTASKKGSSR